MVREPNIEATFRKMARRGASVCPPGVFCFSNTLGIFLLIIAIVAGVLLFKQYYPVTEQKKHAPQPIQIINQPPTVISGGDDRYSRAPEPLRVWQTPPDLRGAIIPPGAIPINIPPRGFPQQYQQVGILKSDDKLLPLYGRQTAYRSDRYNYYTRTDTFNPVQLPIRSNRRDCTDSIGCEELFGGESVKIGGMNQDARVEIFQFDGPTYIPGLV